uniref:F-box domain-containing protein n=1 Tax=Mycena chlorophos TaxID=658473 RepID=A0ABQ0M9M7_MYCCL|nr:predicted protein [Mycena chlorophos]
MEESLPQIAALKRHNSQTLVAILPPELLADIFCRCVPTSIQDVQVDFKQPNSWLAITRVSSHWRDVALSTPQFWSTLVLCQPDLMANMLFRSCSAPLVLRADLTNDPEHSPEPTILEHCSRLGTLHIQGRRAELVTFLANLEHAGAAPYLQCLNFVNTEDSTIEPLWLPRNLFKRDQMLQDRQGGTWLGVHLRLFGCAFPYNSQWYRDLAHLHLDNLGTFQKPSLETLLGILAASPRLQTLAMAYSLPVSFTYNESPGPVVLSHLTSLLLVDFGSWACPNLLHFLVVPPSASVSITCLLGPRNRDCHNLIWTFCNHVSLPYGCDTLRIKHGATGLLLEYSDSSISSLWRLSIDANDWTSIDILATTENITAVAEPPFGLRTVHLHGFNGIAPPIIPGARTFLLYSCLGEWMQFVHTLHIHGGFPTSWLEFMLTQAMLLVGVAHHGSWFSLTDIQFRDTDGVLRHSCPLMRRLCLHGVGFELRDLRYPGEKSKRRDLIGSQLLKRSRNQLPKQPVRHHPSRLLRALKPLWRHPMDFIRPETPSQTAARRERTRRNSQALISRLPPELLADIFCLCVPTSVWAVQRGFKEESSWLAIARVSSYWRDVALSTPEFWSTLVLSEPELTALMLIRSQSAPLIVRADLMSDADNSPEPIIFEQAWRLGTLDIRSPRSQLLTFLANLEHVDAAPHLRCLKIVNSGDLSEDQLWLPSNLFQREQVVEERKAEMQPGSTLHLERCAFPWDSSWYTQMAHLRLESLGPLQIPSTEVLLSVLAASPRLETLALIDSVPNMHKGFRVSLPHLTLLELMDNAASACANLLGFLEVPPSATVIVICEITLTSRRADENYRDLIAAFLTSASLSRYDTVLIRHYDGLALAFSHSLKSGMRRLRIRVPSWDTSCIFATTSQVLSRLDSAVVSTLHLHGFENLAPPLRDFPDLRSYSLFSKLGQLMSHVHTLHIYGGFPTGWLEFMLRQAMLVVNVVHDAWWFRSISNYIIPYRGSDGILLHSFPTMRRLCLHGIDFARAKVTSERHGKRSDEESDEDEDAGSSSKPNPAMLLTALMWARKEGGAPLWSLELGSGCRQITDTDLLWWDTFVDVLPMQTDPSMHRLSLGLSWDSVRETAIDIFTQMAEDELPTDNLRPLAWPTKLPRVA